ncbi:TMAO reductase system periplasmic protein TorT [Salmonella enterica]|uniref:TMAO reductase system periplasmic protein TorT n=2 Tax=Salmonella diarizonae TaxID=59204 RepID=A0A726URK7_SALDZ|nr:TMAO reductase system periplasmic protein TorT [Salmonella enterica]EAA4453892.1 TMAO reductase system periplasmic protein TorT [Salmonella enterica subsp. diarizonae]EBP3746631.1 TMAO reductase system periplasmic protein TorT [Salmonella enterica subsp. arizonae]EDW1846491.1 TMAO reductase system periplasmic protein TorT [Salmonella enterica subsp. enterica]EDW6120541.1 TMAO reductase system periplasmic protein TorT [Salmonella enterica subsp. salamae]EHG2955239.1 TMAO reductase system per
MRAFISFFFLIIIVSNVETALAGTGLLHWTRADRAIPWRQTSVNAIKPWKLCALYPSLKDSYWLSVNYGMQKAAKLYGVDLKVLEANGYRQLATQQQQMMQCREWGADAILLGSSTDRFPGLEQYAGNVPVIELVNMIHDASVATRVGLPWFQMGYLPGRFLAQWSKGKTLNVLLFPGPDEAGGSQEMVAGFRQAIKDSAINIVDIAWGDNDIEVQRNLLQEMLERHPDANVVAGSAIAAEAAMGEGRNLTTPLTIVSFYLTHQVYRGLKRGHILMALSDQMAWQGELAIAQSIKVLQGQPVPENISPPVLILTHKNADSVRVRRSLSPPGFRPVYLYQYTSEAKK